VNVYPSQYQLSELTAHVVSLLERRRAAFEQWTGADEASLVEEARDALLEAGQQFRELADDPAFWQRVTEQVMTVALPRYLKLARAQHDLERRGYDLWRGGDLLSRALYAVGGLAFGILVLRTALPDWLEPLPLAFFVGGPLLPDAQVWLAKRRYRKQLDALVTDMKHEEADRRLYQPLGIDEQVAEPRQPTPAPREKA
jgi:hypothetical protein